MAKFIIIAENLGNIEPLLTQLGPWGKLSSTTYYSESSETAEQVYRHFNLKEGSNQQLHVIGACRPYVGFGLPDVVRHCQQALN